MPYILDIATAVPKYQIEHEDLISFYSRGFGYEESSQFIKKIKLLNRKTQIKTRHSCIPDYKGLENELFTEGNYKQPVERRMAIYKEKVLPLAINAIDNLVEKSGIKLNEVTHILTVSCTGMMAPGLEFLLAEHYNLQHTEKSALNFLGCYAGLKALKQAYYITKANPEAVVLMVCAELCSLHFYPNENDEDLIANLLFADGAAAALVCGDDTPIINKQCVLKIEKTGTAFLPDTKGLMTWDISSTSFKMHLSAGVVAAINANIKEVVTGFLGESINETKYWAIHPGGIKIIEGVRESLGLDNEQVADSLQVMQQHGNMSSPTVLFILCRILDNLKKDCKAPDAKIFTCAFGPGLNVELVQLLPIYFNSL